MWVSNGRADLGRQGISRARMGSTLTMSASWRVSAYGTSPYRARGPRICVKTVLSMFFHESNCPVSKAFPYFGCNSRLARRVIPPNGYAHEQVSLPPCAFARSTARGLRGHRAELNSRMRCFEFHSRATLTTKTHAPNLAGPELQRFRGGFASRRHSESRSVGRHCRPQPTAE